MNNFIQYIGDIQCRVYLFADDIYLLFTGDLQFLDCHEASINYVLSRACDWAVLNKLNFNPSKTKAIAFGNHDCYINISFDKVAIQFVDQLDCLGVILDRGLNFRKHIAKVSAKVSSSLRMLYNLDCFLPLHIRIRISHSILMTHILYCIDVVSGTSETNIREINLIFNRILRYIFSLRISDHVSGFSFHFIGCSFRNFIKIRVLLSLYRIVRTHIPLSVASTFFFSRSTRNPEILLPIINNTIYEKSFLVRASRLWNRLPRDLKTFSYTFLTMRHKFIQHFQNLN